MIGNLIDIVVDCTGKALAWGVSLAMGGCALWIAGNGVAAIIYGIAKRVM